MSNFWNTVQPIMNQRKITQKDIDRYLNKGEGSVHKWIKRDTIPPADYAIKIADYLNEDLRYLITGEIPEELQLYYSNPKIRPIVNLLKDLDDDTVHRAYLCLRTQIEVDKQIMIEQNKKENLHSGTA